VPNEGLGRWSWSLAADGVGPPEVGVGEVARDRVLAYRQPLSDVSIGADLLAAANRHRYVAVPAASTVVDQGTYRRVGVGVDAAAGGLQLVVGDCRRESEGESFRLLGECLAPATPGWPSLSLQVGSGEFFSAMAQFAALCICAETVGTAGGAVLQSGVPGA